MNQQLWLQGLLYTLIASLTPVYAAIASDMNLTARNMTAISIGALIAGATALKAFLSTTFSDSGAADQADKPKEVVIRQPASQPVPTTETKPTPAVAETSSTQLSTSNPEPKKEEPPVI